jgi:hypothetical protein
MTINVFPYRKINVMVMKAMGMTWANKMLFNKYEMENICIYRRKILKFISK